MTAKLAPIVAITFSCVAPATGPQADPLTAQHPAQPITVDSNMLVSELEPELPDRLGVRPFEIVAPETTVWVVLGDGGQCQELRFKPWPDPHSGRLYVELLKIPYEVRDGEIEFKGVTDGAGGHRSCNTIAKIGPNGRLGGADLFADQAACEDARATAVALDDSGQKMLPQCDGVELEIDAWEVDCGYQGRASWSQPRGCFLYVKGLIENKVGPQKQPRP